MWNWHYNMQTESMRHRGALKFGSAIHGALEVFYPPGTKRGPHPAETFATLIDEMGDFSVWTEDDDDKLSAYDLGVAMLEGYVDTYGKDKDIEVLQPEMDFQIDIAGPSGEYLATYVGSFDAAIRFRETGHVGILEHKTGKSIEEVTINSKYGEQGLSYLWAAAIWLKHLGLMDEEETLEMVLFNWLRKGQPDLRPRNKQGHYLNKPSKDSLVTACLKRKLDPKGTIPALTERLLEHGMKEEAIAQLGEVSKTQPRPLFARQELPVSPTSLGIWERRLRAEVWEMAQVRKGHIPIYKSPGDYCKWCDYRDVCELHEMGGDWKGVLALEFKPWDPYESHREALEAN